MFKHPNAPTFPKNYGWVTSKTHNFKPRDVNDGVRRMIAEMLIKGDAKFEHILRECKTTWILAVTLGKDTLHLRIYDPADVDGGRNQVLSTSLKMDRTVFIEINRQKDIRGLTDERIARTLTTAPMVYADRCLRPEEVRLSDQLERTCQGEVLLPDEAFPAPDLTPVNSTAHRPHWLDEHELEKDDA